ncbi:uncharacterized protein BKA55DRAFT_551603, partial [Fusarium redolens]
MSPRQISSMFSAVDCRAFNKARVSDTVALQVLLLGGVDMKNPVADLGYLNNAFTDYRSLTLV